MATKSRPTDPATLVAERECIWRIDTRAAARAAGIAAEDIERATFWAWRLKRDHAEPDPERVAEREPE